MLCFPFWRNKKNKWHAGQISNMLFRSTCDIILSTLHMYLFHVHDNIVISHVVIYIHVRCMLSQIILHVGGRNIPSLYQCAMKSTDVACCQYSTTILKKDLKIKQSLLHTIWEQASSMMLSVGFLYEAKITSSHIKLIL